MIIESTIVQGLGCSILSSFALQCLVNGVSRELMASSICPAWLHSGQLNSFKDRVKTGTSNLVFYSIRKEVLDVIHAAKGATK